MIIKKLITSKIMNKKLMFILMISSLSMADNNNYRTNNYTAWKVINASAKEQFIEVVSVDNLKPNLLKPICLKDNRMIFKYEMMGMDDTFYDKNLQDVNIESLNRLIYKSVVFAMKVDVEEDNDLNGKLDKHYANICSKNKSQRFISPNLSKNGVDSHGVIKYIGDITVKPPF